MEKIDMHVHSNISDGDLDINQIIKLALESDCNKIAITDHEKVFDYSKYNNEYIKIVNGVEFNSAEHCLHILGYGIKDIGFIQGILDSLSLENEKICLELIDELRKEGYDISKKQVEFYIKTTGLRYDNLDKRKIVRYLIYKNYFKNILEVYDTLIGKGQKLYIPIKKLSPENIINLIDKAGGVSVLAHPCTLNLNEYDLRNKIKELMNYGLDGIEVINSKSNLSEKQLYKKLANEFNLIETVGSDFHSPKEQSLGVLAEDKIYNELVEKIKCKTIKT